MTIPAAPDKSRKSNGYLGINFTLVGLMMVCATLIFLQIMQRVTPTWQGNYLLVLAFLVTLEALVSSCMSSEMTIMSTEWLLQHATETVVLLVIVKAAIYLAHGPGQLVADLTGWRTNFFNNFFNMEYLLAIAYLVLIWFIARAFSRTFQMMEEDYSLLEQEKQGFAPSTRANIQKDMIGLVFGIGAVLLLISATLNIKLPFLSSPTERLTPSVITLFLYFLAGFILLAQTQREVMKGRWYIQGYPSTPAINSLWLRASLIFLVVVALVAVLLPTHYSIAFFNLLKIIFSYIFTALSFLFLLVLTPVAGLMNLLGGCSGKPNPSAPTPPPASAPPPVEPARPPVPPWLDVLQSIIFWGIFLAVIVFSIRYYLLQRGDWLTGIRKLGFIQALGRFLRWLHTQFSLTAQGIFRTLGAGIERLRGEVSQAHPGFHPFQAISRRLPPRQRVLLIYLLMVRWNTQNGFKRLPQQTPYEYAYRLIIRVPAAQTDLEVITQLFMEARYSRHTITPEQADSAQAAWEQVYTIFKDHLTQQKVAPA